MERIKVSELTVKHGWRETGEIFSHQNSPVVVDRTALPLFTLKLDEGYRDLVQNGTPELSSSFFAWMRQNMAESPEQVQISRMHDAFNNVFPIPGLPSKVAPEFAPWVVVETQVPDKFVVVQPIILVPQKETDVFTQEKANSSVYVPPRVDPFLVATLSEGKSPSIGVSERAHLREMVRAFWQSISKAAEISKGLPRIELSRREAAEATAKLMQAGADSVSEVATRMKNYVFSQEDSPLSIYARAAIQFSWVKKASEEWMKPISYLAKKGQVELPGNF